MVIFCRIKTNDEAVKRNLYLAFGLNDKYCIMSTITYMIKVRNFEIKCD
jgi:hypothetical protein